MSWFQQKVQKGEEEVKVQLKNRELPVLTGYCPIFIEQGLSLQQLSRIQEGMEFFTTNASLLTNLFCALWF